MGSFDWRDQHDRREERQEAPDPNRPVLPRYPIDPQARQPLPNTSHHPLDAFQARYQSAAHPTRRPRGKTPRAVVALVVVLALVLVTVIGYGGLRLVQSRLSASAVANPIPAENAHVGTTAWIYPASAIASDEIQGYASARSVQANDTLTFYVSTQHAGAPYTATIYRLGWYGGTGAREMQQLQERGDAQGYYDEPKQRLVDCATCTIDPATHMVQANWRPSFQIQIPATWTTGVYLTDLREAATGKVAMLYFVVRGNTSAPYLVTTPDTTTAAYNVWGGYSLYIGLSFTPTDRATQVSLDRPVVPFGGFNWQLAERMPYDQGLPTFINTVRFLEKNGYNLSYESDLDIDQHPQTAQAHRVLISMGHDEYWSATMRSAFQQARDQGISLIFLGANAVYWEIRFAADAQGRADHIILCDKSSPGTTLWRNSNPENALIGVMYAANSPSGTGFPWQLAQNASSPLLKDTGLVSGQAYGCDLVGYEWDTVFDNGKSPKGLVVLSDSPATAQKKSYVSNTTYYYAPSGAFIFASGSIYWARALDAFRLFPGGTCHAQSEVIPGMQKLFQNVLAAALVA